MRCQPNDLCFVVDADPALQGALGRVVRVTMLDLHQGGLLVWELQEPLWVTLACDAMYRGDVYFAGTRVRLRSLYDNWLRPLRDAPGVDEVLMRAGNPHANERVSTAPSDAAHSSLRAGGVLAATVGRKPGRGRFL